MKKTLTALAAAAVVALASTAVPSTADARCFGCAVGVGVGLGVLGGLAVGSAIANSGPGYGPGYAPVAGYEPYAYNGGYPVACPGGYWARRPLVDRWGNLVGYSRPRFFCP
jgi:hypothetical protein